MTAPRAADLPQHSVVASDITIIWLKLAPNYWRSTDGDGGSDSWMQGHLDSGAQVLRVGYGSDQ